MVHLIIDRSEAKSINDNPSWSMVFGRRKVGKTFLMEHFVKHDVFCFVSVERTVFARGMLMDEYRDLGTFAVEIVKTLDAGRTCIIDEFQRLPMTTLESIAKVHPKGRLILTGSGKRTTLRLITVNSPLLALVRPMRLDLVRPKDMLMALSKTMGPQDALGLAPILRDPWTVPYYKGTGFLEELVGTMRYMVPAFVGEVFNDDDRELTLVYSSILSLIGGGCTDHWRIAQTLHSRKIIRTGASANVIPFMDNMVDMGLLEKVKRYGKARTHAYEIPSFPVKLFYYLDSRYGISGREVSYSEVKPTVEAQLRLGIEGFIADLFAEELGGRKELIKDADREIDLLVTVRNKPQLVGEVKWGRASKGDVSYFLSKVEDLRCRKVFVALEPIETDDDVEVLTPRDIMRIAGAKVTHPRKGSGRRTPPQSKKAPDPRRKVVNR